MFREYDIRGRETDDELNEDSVYHIARGFGAILSQGGIKEAVVGNDAAWTQIAREQVKMLHDDVGTVLARTDYHAVAAGFGAFLQKPFRRQDLGKKVRELLGVRDSSMVE